MQYTMHEDDIIITFQAKPIYIPISLSYWRKIIEINLEISD